jgi:hypothetical protein
MEPMRLTSDVNDGTESAAALTDMEHQVMELTSQLWSALCSMTGYGRTRAEDLHEASLHIHALQNMVLAQAAARAYPDRYRLLGLSIEVPREMTNE